MGKIYDDNGFEQDNEYLTKKLEYIKYIVNHVRNVNTAYKVLFATKKYSSLPEGVSYEDWYKSVGLLKTIVEKHDASKYSDIEFEPYRRHFYPTEEESKQVEDLQNKAYEDYQNAWKHHYMNNDHHPEYWTYIGEDGNKLEEPNKVGVPMPLVAVMHMFCDWYAMDLFQNKTDHAIWYQTDASKDERECLNPETKKLIKDMFYILYGAEVSEE